MDLDMGLPVTRPLQMQDSIDTEIYGFAFVQMGQT